MHIHTPTCCGSVAAALSVGLALLGCTAKTPPRDNRTAAVRGAPASPRAMDAVPPGMPAPPATPPPAKRTGGAIAMSPPPPPPPKRAPTARIAPRRGLGGCWSPTAKQGAKLLLHPRGHFRWGSEAGRYLASGGQVWLLGPKRVGTKWKFRFEGQQLVLHFPESFRYLGRGRYFYFRFQSPRTTHRFTWAPASGCP